MGDELRKLAQEVRKLEMQRTMSKTIKCAQIVRAAAGIELLKQKVRTR